jgi:hypothetical protein
MPSRSIPSSSFGAGLLLALALAGGPMSPAPARAAERADARKAKAHYKQGEEAFKAGRFEEAYRQWQLGYQLSSRPLFLLNMAHAERRRGDLRNARALYQRFLLMEPQSKLRAEIEGVLREIDSALAAEPAGLAAESRPADAGSDGADAVSPPPEAAAAALAPAPMADPAPPVAAAATAPPPIDPLPLGRMAPPVPPAPTLIDRAGEAPADLQASPPPIYKRWWFWAGTGTVVALGVAATFLLRADPWARNGSIGTLGAPP